MLATITQSDAQTIQFVLQSAVGCSCDEYRTNQFCGHLVFYTVAKIRAHEQERSNPEMKGGENILRDEMLADDLQSKK